MNIEHLRAYCLNKKAATEGFPFGGDTLVFKVMNKMFALIAVDDPTSVNLKCEPSRAIELREAFEEVKPGYHMNKKHWNTVSLTGDISTAFIEELIDHSYDLVIRGLSKKEQVILSTL